MSVGNGASSLTTAVACLSSIGAGAERSFVLGNQSHVPTARAKMASQKKYFMIFPW